MKENNDYLYNVYFSSLDGIRVPKAVFYLPFPCMVLPCSVLRHYNANLLHFLQLLVSPAGNNSNVGSCFGQLIYFLCHSLDGPYGTPGKQTHCDKTSTNNPNQRRQKPQKSPIAIQLVNVNR